MKALFAAAALLAAPLAARGQQPTVHKPPASAQALPPVTESVEVSITNIEVIVTDSKGNRVSGLTRDDFEVRQDDIPQVITNFYAVSGGKVLLEDGKVLAMDDASAGDLPQEVKARYIIFIDNVNIQPQNRNRMFRRLKEWVAQTIGHNAEAMVVTWNRSLKVRRKFTSEGGDIVGLLEEIELDTGSGTNLVSDRRDALEKIDNSQSAAEGQQIARQNAEAVRHDIRSTVDALKDTINGLAGVAGRKTLIYVSEGLPSTVGLELYDAVQQKYGQQVNTLEQFEFNMDSSYATIVQAANAQGVTIWPLDASGLQVNDLVSAENRQIQNRPNDFLMRTNMQAPLQMLADQTGGLSAINTNDWKKNLDELAKDFSNFYSIGYRTHRAAADRPHSIVVTVKKKGLTVRTRKGFVEKTIETRTAEAVVAALNYTRDENPLGVALALGESSPYDAENFTIPAKLTIPIGRIGLVPTGDHYEGTLFFYFVVLDVSGKQSDLTMKEEKIRVPNARLTDAQAKFYPYEVKMLVVPGGQKVSIAVRDGVTSQVSYLQKNFFVSVLPKEHKEKDKQEKKGS